MVTCVPHYGRLHFLSMATWTCSLSYMLFLKCDANIHQEVRCIFLSCEPVQSLDQYSTYGGRDPLRDDQNSCALNAKGEHRWKMNESVWVKLHKRFPGPLICRLDPWGSHRRFMWPCWKSRDGSLTFPQVGL